jgi:IS5 family transposase
MSSFFSYSADLRIKKNNTLLKLNKLIDWTLIEKRLKGIYKKDIEDKGGERPYDPIKMFKSILLGQWYSLSDPALEEALSLRLDFMMFTGFELLKDCPDETTLCRFRNRLIKNRLDKKLFLEINSQLEKLGLKVKNSTGAILDATIIESAARPKRQLEIEEDRNEKETIITKIESKDPDSRWLKKGPKFHFGYKGFVSVDSDHGYINKIHVTSANVAEVNQLEKLIDDIDKSRVYADKGYTSEKNRRLLKKKKLKDGIMHKSSKGKQLSKWEKLKNRLISKKRYIVERAFGTLKRNFKFRRACYIGNEKVEAQFYFKAMCFNLLKASNQMQLT